MPLFVDFFIGYLVLGSFLGLYGLIALRDHPDWSSTILLVLGWPAVMGVLERDHHRAKKFDRLPKNMSHQHICSLKCSLCNSDAPCKAWWYLIQTEYTKRMEGSKKPAQ